MSVTAPKTSTSAETGLPVVLPTQNVEKKERSTLNRSINPLNDNSQGLPTFSLPDPDNSQNLQKTFKRVLNIAETPGKEKAFDPAKILMSFNKTAKRLSSSSIEESSENTMEDVLPSIDDCSAFQSFMDTATAIATPDKTQETPTPSSSENAQIMTTDESIVTQAFLQAEHCFKEKKFDEAFKIIKSLERMLSNGTEAFHAKFYSNLGAILSAQGKGLEAINAYRKGLEFEHAPDILKARLSANLGIALRKAGQHEEAIKVLKKGLAFATIPDDLKFKLWLHLGRAYIPTNESVAAIKAFQECLKLEKTTDEEKAHACLPLAVLLLKENNLEALEIMRKALALKGVSKETKVTLYYNSGIMLYTHRRYAEAVLAFHSGTELNVDAPDIMAKMHLYLGFAWAKAGRRVKAIFAYQDGLKFDRADPSTKASLSYYLKNSMVMVPTNILNHSSK